MSEYLIRDKRFNGTPETFCYEIVKVDGGTEKVIETIIDERTMQLLYHYYSQYAMTVEKTARWWVESSQEEKDLYKLNAILGGEYALTKTM